MGIEQLRGEDAMTFSSLAKSASWPVPLVALSVACLMWQGCTNAPRRTPASIQLRTREGRLALGKVNVALALRERR
jgi:hypothetical protein